MKNMSGLGLIPKLENELEKCEICSMTKITRKPHKLVERNTELLELFFLISYIFIQTNYRGKQVGVSPLQAASMAGGSIPSEKQNDCIQLRANLAATWTVELPLL